MERELRSARSRSTDYYSLSSKNEETKATRLGSMLELYSRRSLYSDRVMGYQDDECEDEQYQIYRV